MDGLRARFAERVSARLFADVTERPMTRPGLDRASVAAAFVAVGVHLFTLAVVALGVLILAWSNWSIFAIVISAALLGLAVLMRPRLGRVPEETIDPAAAPTLYGLVNRVAERVGTRPVWRIVLDPDFNAAFGVVGWRRRRVLVIGYPLWNLLAPQERVALLGHELGHSVNGDHRRGLLVGSSLRSLVDLYVTLRTTSGEQETLIGMVVSALSRLVTWVLAMPVLGLVLLQERLLAQSGQRAEYYADHLAAGIAGPAHTMSMLEKLRLAEPAMAALGTAVIRRDEDIWASGRAWLAGRSAADQARLSAHDEASPHRIDASHPKTRLRVGAIRARAYGGDVLVLNSSESARIDGELVPLLPGVTREIRDAARS